MRIKTSAAKRSQESENFYTAFGKLDGRHPWMEQVPEGFVAYRVRRLNTGKVAYFNFVLAKEMGLIDSQHPHEMTEELENKLVETFSIQIINEYDEINKRRIPPESILPNKFMATRYLQLQHSNKQGKTSGDGRGIWNGTIQHRGLTWDVSSRGTGVTCLAPGAVEANRPLKTGDTAFGYGCGLAEIDELLGAAILAEIMHLQGINTERVLCIIDLGRGYGIGVRAAPNLIRPAHLFLYLKQERHAELKAATNYFIQRQVLNKKWHIKSKLGTVASYEEMTELVCDAFANFTAKLDIDYVFAWLDWDGDNVLADAGIIDYGSVRQFGIRHDKYRYDDVERFSTNLNEQRMKARLIVQVFIQMTDYLKTEKKKPLKAFANHPVALKFDKLFIKYREERLLFRMGFNQIQRENITKAKTDTFQNFENIFNYFERAKVSGTQVKVADGVNHPALFNMRNILGTLPQYFLQSKDSLKGQMPETEFFKAIMSTFGKAKDAKMGQKQKIAILKFQTYYKELVTLAAGKGRPENILKGISTRAQILNSEKRITGNALIEIVEAVLNEKKRGLSHDQIQKIVDRFIHDHMDLPEAPISRHHKHKAGVPAVRPDLYSKLLTIVDGHRDDI
ncbi:hypothetical protein [Bdellovibrio sp. HCB337]|uniref:hypothetical protein n=1 Tax=Bdellovibrio sp. HCB337 TaxID=3394358 RepID=UPI0039A6B2B4